MPLLTDDEAVVLATSCAPHKIIINGNGLISTVQAACTLAYQPQVFALIQSDPDVKQKAFDLAMALHDAENAIEPLLKALAFEAAEYAKDKH